VPLDTLIFDPSGCNFPSPRLPLLPSDLDWLRSRPPIGRPTTLPDTVLTFSRGRYALHEAYRLAGLDEHGTLLAPAYHCRTMLDPALALGGDIVLYPVQADLSIDMASLDELARNLVKPLRALLATHYFGFPNDFAPLAEWCGRRNIALIEDCSHTLATDRNCPQGVGSHGDYVVSSPYKFLPSPDGGLLWIRHPQAETRLAQRRSSWSCEIRAAKHTLESARRRPDTPPAVERLHEEIAVITTRTANCAKETRRQEGTSSAYQPRAETLEALRLSRLIHRRADIVDIARRRRDNYRCLYEELEAIPHCRPLYPRLSDHCVPYMLPLLIDKPDPHFFQLKRLGVPIWRWDSLAVSPCPIANEYRLRLLHLPCHQSLAPPQLEWIVEAIRLVMTSANPGAAK
jgi:dTDP-4-amino-4,6-dideoxygalactose transaminase